MKGSLLIKRGIVLLQEGWRRPLVVRRFLWRWRGELLMGGLWCLKPLDYVPLAKRPYRELLGFLVRRSGLFDEAYYSDTNVDVAQAGQSALRHYVTWGDREGRCPLAVFDPDFYRKNTSAVTLSVNSLLHYVWVGAHTGKPPSPWFDNEHYLNRNKDVALSGINPLRHFLGWGGVEGRSPSASFDAAYYLRTYPDVAESGVNPLLHYVIQGRSEGRHGRYEDASAPQTGKPEKQKPSEKRTISVERVIDAAICPDVPPEVDVIVPVYRNRMLTLRCINSVLTSPTSVPYQLIILDDATPEPSLSADLEKLKDLACVRLIKHSENRGFVATVNEGMGLHSDRDVVILNSDAEVFGDWLGRLRNHAYSKERTASVTPLSNNATICSYPRFLHDNPYPLELTYAELDELAQRVNRDKAVSAPTGVGFCMYIRRDALVQVGLFDEQAFGRGYGEENDWCQRAIGDGWQNLIAADLFVRHHGGASFQGEQGERVRHALRVMKRKHPNYLKDVDDFIATDLLLSQREKLDWSRLVRFSKTENVLMVCHNRGGGAERHFQEDAEAQRKKGRGVFFLRPVPGRPTHAFIQHSACTNVPNLPQLALSRVNYIAGFLSQLGITCIHSHGLVDFEPEAATHVSNIAERLNVPLHVDVHDYKVICPRINLAKTDGRYCGEPSDPEACNDCLKTEGNDFGVIDIVAWRELHQKVLSGAEKVYVPDADVSERLNRYYPDVQFSVLPHESIDYRPRSLNILPGRDVRVVVIGAIGKIKGFEVLLGCARYIKEQNLPIKLILFGYSLNDKLLIRSGVEVLGRYEEVDALKKLQSVNADIAFFPNLWPETYSYTLSHAMRVGLPIVAFDLGAIARRLRQCGGQVDLLPVELSSYPKKICDRFFAFL